MLVPVTCAVQFCSRFRLARYPAGRTSGQISTYPVHAYKTNTGIFCHLCYVFLYITGTSEGTAVNNSAPYDLKNIFYVIKH
jgi:hypothetical protein